MTTDKDWKSRRIENICREMAHHYGFDPDEMEDWGGGIMLLKWEQYTCVVSDVLRASDAVVKNNLCPDGWVCVPRTPTE